VAGLRDDRFVRVRLVQAWGLDLDVFLADPRLTLFGVLMNADGAVYGRFSPRDVPSLPKILDGALALHAKWPANRAELEGKRSGGLPWRKTSDVPELREKFGPAGIQGRGCLHCHDVLPGVVRSLEREGKAVPRRLSTPYPVPERIGLTLDAGLRVVEIQKGGAAERGGVKTGDRLARLGGQPLLSTADVEWALYVAADEGELAMEVEGGGVLKLRLDKGWRNP
jgi:hypothetical protein